MPIRLMWICAVLACDSARPGTMRVLDGSVDLHGCADRGGGADSAADVGPPDMPALDTGGTACEISGVTGSLSGVSIRIWSDRCTYEVGEGGTFHYEITIDPMIRVHTSATGSCECPVFTDNPLSFVVYGIEGQEGARYCLCDAGCCAPQPDKDLFLLAGKYAASFEWPGLTWWGPRDTDPPPPYGPPFPPGNAVVRVSFKGPQEGDVVAELPIQIVEP